MILIYYSNYNIMLSIKERKEILKGSNPNNLRERLDSTLESIIFLESIYTTSGGNSHYSQAFKDAAYNESQALRQLTSAIYGMLRELGESAFALGELSKKQT